MKNFFLLLCFAWASFPALSRQNNPAIINVMTYNIRYDNPGDSINAWPNRKDWVKELVEYHETDILCIQEALNDQVEYLLAGTGFALEGVGRTDGKKDGEYSAILYDKARFEKRKGGHFWLSETPEKPSKGWDAQIVRICTWIQLYDKQSKKEFFVFNTHYDHMGVKARENSSILIKEKINAIAGEAPVILTGDLNSTPETPAIATINSFLKSAKEVSKLRPYGPEGTFNGFKWDSDLNGQIDYIFVDNRVEVLKFGVLSDSKNQRYPSDHLPVLAKVSIQ